YADKDVEVARRRAEKADLALAGEANAGAVLDPRGDADRQRLFAPDAPLTAAGAARFLDYRAGALAGRTGALDGEEALLRTHPAVALAGATRGRARARFGAAAAA